MKKFLRLFLVVAVFTTMVLSACGGAVTETSSGSNKPLASLIEFTGIIEEMNGNQWVVDGQVVIVDETLIASNSYQVGDTVEIKGETQADGSIVAATVKLEDSSNENSNDDNSNDDNSNSSNSNDDNSNSSNSNDGNSNDDNSNDGNSNDDNSNDGNSNDDNSNDDNSNDDNSNDDSGSGGGGNDNGGDDSNENDD